MNQSDIERLDRLRKEKGDLKYFLRGRGNFGVKIHRFFLTKFFGCGTHKLEIDNDDVIVRIESILSERLEEINKEIEEI